MKNKFILISGVLILIFVISILFFNNKEKENITLQPLESNKNLYNRNNSDYTHSSTGEVEYSNASDIE